MTQEHAPSNDYDYDIEPDPMLSAHVAKYAHLFFAGDELPERVMEVWTLDRPCGEIKLQATERESLFRPMAYDQETVSRFDVITFIVEFGRWFHYQFDGYELRYSRFVELIRSDDCDAAVTEEAVREESHPYEIAQRVIKEGYSDEFRRTRNYPIL